MCGLRCFECFRSRVKSRAEFILLLRLSSSSNRDVGVLDRDLCNRRRFSENSFFLARLLEIYSYISWWRE